MNRLKVPRRLEHTVKEDTRRGYTQIEQTLWSKKLKTRPPQSVWLHFVLLFTTATIGNIIYVIVNEFQSNKYKLREKEKVATTPSGHQIFIALLIALILAITVVPILAGFTAILIP